VHLQVSACQWVCQRRGAWRGAKSANRSIGRARSKPFGFAFKNTLTKEYICDIVVTVGSESDDVFFHAHFCGNSWTNSPRPRQRVTVRPIRTPFDTTHTQPITHTSSHVFTNTHTSHHITSSSGDARRHPTPTPPNTCSSHKPPDQPPLLFQATTLEAHIKHTHSPPPPPPQLHHILQTCSAPRAAAAPATSGASPVQLH
jgi:hypothetical protein